MTDTARPCDVDGCDRPVADAFVCAHCAWRLGRALGEVAALEEDLPIVLAKLVRYSEQVERVRGSSSHPLPFNDAASEAAWLLRNTLVGVVRMVAEERERDMPEADTLADMAAWLDLQREWLRHHEAGHEAVDEILHAVRECWRVCDRPNTRARFEVGPCPNCTGTVRAYIPAREDRPAHMDCDGCGERWESHQFLNVGRRILATEQQRIAPYIDTSTAALALGVSVRTIQRWIVAGRLTNHGTPGRILLHLQEINQLKAETA